MNESQAKFWTFTFNIDPVLNSGFTTAFKQDNEPYWWFDNHNDTRGSFDSAGPAAGEPPDFTGASFKELHQWTDKLL